MERALEYLEDKHNIARRYLLVGHSAGATLAFELHSSSSAKVPAPLGVLGVAGIYHFEAFLEAHSQIPAYQEFMDNAFPNRAFWEKAAPYTNRERGLAVWEDTKAVIIAQSKDDELIEGEQAAFMLERARLTPHTRKKAHFLPATGKHDEIWESGTILADLIAKSLNILDSNTD